MEEEDFMEVVHVDNIITYLENNPDAIDICIQSTLVLWGLMAFSNLAQLSTI